ncbi:hypothetical protein DAETH_28640 [Deinococcus aetherius]|uniref:Uncharacterized protein n=1 Tax=Deinococcus aetherius TaxID=200252 RepID=A0ABN6RHS6_9DEIO|nr:hypothetical protein [Deinococcus aetherius]BDP42895.1 hypothetical protein DAETH_28640 [Deinococcus aetherius]
MTASSGFLTRPPPAPPAEERVFALLSPTRELTPFGLADLHPELGLSEDEVLDCLVTLARARRIDLWASLPTFEGASDGQ